jgi:hypothetical protein
MGQKAPLFPIFLVLASSALMVLPRAHAAHQQTQLSRNNSAPVAEGAASLLVTVRDENGVAVASANIALFPPNQAPSITQVSDYAGKVKFVGLQTGRYRLVVEKQGFYQLAVNNVGVHAGAALEVRLNHTQEFKQTVHVVYSPPAIDPSRAASTQKLSTEDIINLPYPVTRDIRTALPLMPDVLPDQNGQIHVDGADSNQMVYLLDGFDVTQPVNNLNEIRVSTDAIRSVDLEDSRESVEYEQGSGGILNLQTMMGDDHYRFTASDFVPSLSTSGGFHIQGFTPRVTFSGPIARGRAWFLDGIDGEYDHNVFTDLPPGENSDYIGRISNLARVQVNLSPTNQLSGSFLVNDYHEDHTDLSILQPVSTTTRLMQPTYFVSLQDQITLGNGLLVQAGFGWSQFSTTQTPLGSMPYVQLPGSAQGNYYMTSQDTARRYEGRLNVYVPPATWHGNHQFLVGGDLERTTDREEVEREPFTMETASGVLEQSVLFTGPPQFEQENFELAGYVQDRWAISPRLFLVPGFRLEGDDLIRGALAAPRVAGTYMITRDGKTKLSAGAGLYYDRTNLAFLEQALQGQRLDTFYGPNGTTVLGTLTTEFAANAATLQAPRFFNWSFGFERELPWRIFLDAEFVERHGEHGFDYENLNSGTTSSGVPASGLFVLENGEQDKYDGVTFTARHTFGEGYNVMVSYSRSSATSNAVLRPTLDNPLFSAQLSGPFPWDSPNRILTSGWLPVPHFRAWTFGYSLDWHDGYTYSLLNEQQELVGLPDSQRFPRFFVLNVHLEKRFQLFGYELAIRGGFNDVTGSENPSYVENNINAPNFGEFGGFGHRAFTGRIRFLGRK